jgi:apolipoprotein N-acyltransferase
MAAVAGGWVFMEWIRLFFFCGFTWNPVGLALTDSPYSLQMASLFGIFGLSFWVIWVNLLALQSRFALWALMAFFPYLYGWVQLNHSLPIQKELKVALVQTALYPEQKEQLMPPLEQWERILGVLDKKQSFDLVVFPEAVLPFGAHGAAYDYEEIQKYFDSTSLPPLREPYAVFVQGKWKVSNAFLMQALANHYQAHIIAGLDDVDLTGQYNAAFHFSPQNLPYERYEKRVLVPVGEYMPLPKWSRFSRFLAKEFGIYSSFDHGTQAKVFQTPMPVGVSICLEETFSHLTREMRLKGAEIFVNLTNDVWFPRSKLPRQHFDHGRVRAVENGVPILRACNTGLTGVVDCFGRLVAHLPASEEKAGALYFTLPVKNYQTLYMLWGDWAILLVSGAALLVQVAKKKLL